jgi:hypothetical protein
MKYCASTIMLRPYSRPPEEQRLISLKDKRANYRLVGAIWLNQPLSGPNPAFTVKQSFVIASDQSTDDPRQAIAGEVKACQYGDGIFYRVRGCCAQLFQLS